MFTALATIATSSSFTVKQGWTGKVDLMKLGFRGSLIENTLRAFFSFKNTLASTSGLYFMSRKFLWKNICIGPHNSGKSPENEADTGLKCGAK